MVAYEHLAAMHFRLGEYDESRATLEAGLARDPAHGVLRANLAWMLATSPASSVRDGEMAVVLAEQICKEQGWSNPYAMDTLAAAWAERGDFERAIGFANSALMLASEAGDAKLASDLAARIELYRNTKPYRDQ
jgi:tetratricopeptide (TPR) repeat protein